MKRFIRDEEGGVAIVVAIVLPIMIGFSALAIEYGAGLTTQIEHQRVADLASYAGAVAFGQAKTEEAMRASAQAIAQLHGIPAAQVTVKLLESPRSTGAQAVSVTIQAPRSIYLAKILGAEDLTIAAASMAEIGGKAEGIGCVIALDPSGSGVTMSGGTTLSAPKCNVASNATITSPCGTKIVTDTATYGSNSAPVQPSWCKTIQKSDGTPATLTKAMTVDPLQENKVVLTAVDRIKDVANVVAPGAPSGSSGPDLKFIPPSWNPSAGAAVQAALESQGCTGTFTSMWVVTCDPTRSSFHFGHFLIGSGLTVEFNLSGAASATYSFASIKSEGGGNYRFGPGAYNVPGGITMGGSEARFGAGTFKVGQGPCGFSICGGNNGVMEIAGPSTFELSAGVLVEGSNKAILGSGAGNSYRIGPSSNGRAVHVRSGSLVLAGAAGAASLFEIKGRLETGGGSCLALPAATHHDIAGSIDVQGALELGAGVYTIDGYLALGQSSGGSAQCNGRSTSLFAKDVTIVVSGKELMTGWACQGAAFCASSGYNDMVLTSPLSGDYAQLGVIGPTTITAGATLTSGAGSGEIGGAFYFPKGPIKMSGGAGTKPATPCLTIIGATITVSGGAATASECEALGSGAGGAKSVKLVR